MNKELVKNKFDRFKEIKKELLDNLTKTKSSFATNISKGHSVMPKADGKQLIVGKNIKLSGAIDVCESLVVEGTLEANLNGAKYLDIVYGGSFTGTAEVEEAPEVEDNGEDALVYEVSTNGEAKGEIVEE